MTTLCFITALSRDKCVCVLTKSNTDGEYFCSVKAFNPVPDDDYFETFMDTDSYEILLCHNKNGSESCKKLVAKYKPVEHSKDHSDFLFSLHTQIHIYKIQMSNYLNTCLLVCLSFTCPLSS